MSGSPACADVARLKRKPDTYALGYLLGPRINAAGRIGNAALALTLLTTRDKGEAAQIAQELERLNRERQEIELAVVDQAMVQADNMLGKERRGSVLRGVGQGLAPGRRRPCRGAAEGALQPAELRAGGGQGRAGSPPAPAGRSPASTSAVRCARPSNRG